MMLTRLGVVVQQGGLDPSQRDRVLEALGWICSEQLEAGFEGGEEALRDLGWSS